LNLRLAIEKTVRRRRVLMLLRRACCARMHGCTAIDQLTTSALSPIRVEHSASRKRLRNDGCSSASIVRRPIVAIARGFVDAARPNEIERTSGGLNESADHHPNDGHDGSRLRFLLRSLPTTHAIYRLNNSAKLQHW
jgi:hypothetical protein